jgi:RNA polymerase sigma factor for flagellar operon FliA
MTSHLTQQQQTKLLEQHAALVKKIAYQLMAKLPPNIEMDDLIQSGMMGLIEALDRYEEVQGAEFETYASTRIRGAMLDELRSIDWVPRGVRKNMRNVETAIRQLEQELTKPPSDGQVAKKLNMSIEQYYDILRDCSGHQLVYYEDFHDEDSSDHFLDHFINDSANNPMALILSDEFHVALVESIDALPEREKILMGLYYEQELNLKEIGAVMTVSESRVSQLHTQAISRIRAHLKEKLWTGQV